MTTATADAPAQSKETRGFQAEVKQLLHLMIHSLYGNKEIFLRELISNASDAADKLRFEAIATPSLLDDDSDLKIHIDLDKEARTLTIRDNGIGMSRDEVVSNIGTIARSGTREFFSRLTGDQQKDAHLIGQFGVGFYSAFIVADKVTLTTRRAGQGAADGVRWESTGDGEYTLETVEKAARGTEVTLHLRAAEDDFLEPWRVKNVVRKYSDHIQIPIVMKGEAKPETAEGDAKDVTPPAEETVNRASALWTRGKSEITAEQYEEFYKSVSHDWDKPLAWTHNRVEGKQEYTQLLYIPARAPFDLWDRQAKHGVKLYVRRVFIMDDAEQLLPRYLRFVRGVIDSSDLPLNVSREILQESKDVEAIKGGVTKRVLSMLEDLASNEAEKYAKFWNEFGRAFKEGLAEDFKNKEQIARLCRFASTQTGKEEPTVGFADYVARMKEGQEAIYYLSADGYAAAARSPHLEVFRKKGIEVLLMTEPVDEWVMGYLHEFDGKPIKSVAKGALDLGKLADEEEKKAQDRVSELLKPFIEKVKAALGDKVKEVRVTHRLTDSPACLVVEDHDMSANLERLLKSAGQKVGKTAPILEVNPEHPLVARLKADLDNPNFEDWAWILFEQSTLAEGGQLDDPAGFVQRLNALMLKLAG
jgi:molecular chaperone HtpG